MDNFAKTSCTENSEVIYSGYKMYQELIILRRHPQWSFCAKGKGDSNGRIEAERQRRNYSLLAPIWYSLVEWEAEHMKRRFFAFSVCMAVLLAFFTGCYSAQKNGPSAPASSQTVQSDSGSATENSVEIRTYDIPEENVQAGTRYVPSPTTGGFGCGHCSYRIIFRPTTR